jgi:hypothetical protein
MATVAEYLFHIDRIGRMGHRGQAIIKSMATLAEFAVEKGNFCVLI